MKVVRMLSLLITMLLCLFVVPANADITADDIAVNTVATVTTSNGETTQYTTFDDARRAWYDGCILTLWKDCEVKKSITMSDGQRMLNLNKHMLTLKEVSISLYCLRILVCLQLQTAPFRALTVYNVEEVAR